MSRTPLAAMALALALGAARADEPSTPLGPTAAPKPAIDVDGIQGILAVGRLDGWLLYGYREQNPIALEIVRPEHTTRRWFYFIPARGEPVALVHKVEAQAFTRIPGRRVEYAGWRELDTRLKEILKGKKRIAMEWSTELPALSHVDAGTLEKVRGLGVEVASSAELVQSTKSRWDKEGRASHYVAVHHLVALKNDAFAFIGKELAAGRRITEYDVQQRLWKGYGTRGLESDAPPIVAAGLSTADATYIPTREGAREIRQGDLIVIEVWARQAGNPDAIYADVTWVGYAGKEVPARFADAFALVVRARDEATAMIAERVKSRKLVRGWEADKVAREVIAKAGFGDRFIHRTGHSLDTRAHGDGVNLDDLETHDSRPIVQGVGFTVEPGVYLPGEFGVRTMVDCWVGPGGLEITTPAQKEITPLYP